MCKFYTKTYYQKNGSPFFSHDLTYNTCTFDTWCIFFWNMGLLFSHYLTYNTCTFDTWCIFFGPGYIFSPTEKHTTWKKCTCSIGADGKDLSNISANITVQYKKSRHSSVFLFRKICRSTSRQCGM